MIGDLKVVLTTGSMNRLSSLRRSLATWLELAEVDMILIVDWGSDEPLREALRDIRDPRLNILRVVGQKYWCNSKCHNLELRMVSNAGLMFRVDNDNLVRRDFFSRHPIATQSFYAVNWRSVPPEVDDKRNLAGTLLIEPKYLLAVNGYNERLIHYGKEDDDLYDRLTALGLQWREMDLDTLDHIPHDDSLRYKNLKIAPDVKKLIDPTVYGMDEKGALTGLSNYIAKTQPWTMADRMTNWNVIRLADNYWTCYDLSCELEGTDAIFRPERRRAWR